MTAAPAAAWAVLALAVAIGAAAYLLLTTATRDLPGFVEQVRQALDELES